MIAGQWRTRVVDAQRGISAPRGPLKALSSVKYIINRWDANRLQQFIDERLNTPSDIERFDAGVRKILSVSHDELKRREEQWKRDRQRAGKAKPGPKPKTSTSARASRTKT